MFKSQQREHVDSRLGEQAIPREHVRFAKQTGRDRSHRHALRDAPATAGRSFATVSRRGPLFVYGNDSSQCAFPQHIAMQPANTSRRFHATQLRLRRVLAVPLNDFLCFTAFERI